MWVQGSNLRCSTYMASAITHRPISPALHLILVSTSSHCALVLTLSRAHDSAKLAGQWAPAFAYLHLPVLALQMHAARPAFT